MGLLYSKQNENIELAKQMLTLGIDIDQICNITKLSKNEVEKLVNAFEKDL